MALLVVADIILDVERPPRAHKSRSTVPSDQLLAISSDIGKILPFSQSVPFRDRRFIFSILYLTKQKSIFSCVRKREREREIERKRVRKTN